VQVPPLSSEVPPPPFLSSGQEPSSAPSSSAGAPRERQEGDAAVELDVFRVLRHKPIRYANLVICEVCASYMQLPGGPCRQLATPCKGVAQVPSTRSNHLAFLRRAAKGLHPKTGCSLSQQVPGGDTPSWLEDAVPPVAVNSSMPLPEVASISVPVPPVGNTQQVPPCAELVGVGVESSGPVAAGLTSWSVELEDVPNPDLPTESASISALREVARTLRVSAPCCMPDPSADGSGSD